MRGLIKRDDPKLQASVHTPGAAGQLPDGACLRSFAVAGGAAAAHAHDVRKMSLYLDVYCHVEPHQTPRRSFVGGMLHSPPHLPRPRASSRLIGALAVTLPTRSIWFPASIYHLLLEVKRLVAIDQLVCGPVLHASLLCGVDSAINRPVALSRTCRGWLSQDARCNARQDR